MIQLLRALPFLALCLLAPKLSEAEEVVLGISQDEVAISTRFDGSDLLIYGAIKRESPPPADNPLQVVLTLQGPSTPLEVRRKSRRWGIWINTASATIDSAPSYYAVATSAPWSEAISETENLRHSISIERAIRHVGDASGVPDPQAFTKAAIRIRSEEESYTYLEEAVNLRESTLFDTRLSLPDSLTEGTYPMRVFLTRNGRVVSILQTEITVRKVGLERWLYNLAHDQALLYGLMSLIIAVVAGWIASTIFRLIREA